ncbi:MAG: hypothetical protein QOF43_923 [Gaiellaceae bacterium]|jgi:hypothetical protein|nr:hypothetical protein [Gaiellaceae bacterium]
MSRLDEFLPKYDVRERHERRVPAPPELALAAALGMPVAPDGLVRTLFRLRGLPGGGSVQGALRSIGFQLLVEEPDCIVLGAAGRPWSPRSRLAAFDKAGPGQVRMVFDLTAASAGDGTSILATETRVAAMDAKARRAFRRYWLAVGPFSGLIRRRWLAAAERTLR